jgi:hypothetical protein
MSLTVAWLCMCVEEERRNAACNLLKPAFGRARPRQPPPETSNVEIDRISEGA